MHMPLTAAFENGGRSGLGYWTSIQAGAVGLRHLEKNQDSRRIKGYAVHFLGGLEEDY